MLCVLEYNDDTVGKTPTVSTCGGVPPAKSIKKKNEAINLSFIFMAHLAGLVLREPSYM